MTGLQPRIDSSNDSGRSRAAAHWHRGNAQCELRRWDEALESFGEAIEHHPRFAEAHCNLGNVHRILEHWDDALACYDRALAVDPEYRMVWSNRGIVLKEMHRFDEALASFDRAVALARDDATACFNRGILRLLQGDLARGWLDYEWRWEDRAGSVFKQKRSFAQPRWTTRYRLSVRAFSCTASKATAIPCNSAGMSPWLPRWARG